MKLLIDFLPILLFFLAYKFYDIYIATGVCIIASLIQFLFLWRTTKRVDLFPLITLFAVLVLGGATLFFHNVLFIKWKPTIVNWILASIFIIGSWYKKKPFLQFLLEKTMDKSSSLACINWKKLNYIWISFFFLLGLINLYVVYHFSTAIWVNFKLFGFLGLTLLFMLIQAMYIHVLIQKS